MIDTGTVNVGTRTSGKTPMAAAGGTCAPRSRSQDRSEIAGPHSYRDDQVQQPEHVPPGGKGPRACDPACQRERDQRRREADRDVTPPRRQGEVGRELAPGHEYEEDGADRAVELDAVDRRERYRPECAPKRRGERDAGEQDDR